METTRREFLKLVAATVGAVAAPVSLSIGAVLELEAVIDDALFQDAMSIGKVSKNGVTVNLDMEKVWRSVYLVDQRDQRWTTQDQGKAWACGDFWFNVEGECSWG